MEQDSGTSVRLPPEGKIGATRPPCAHKFVFLRQDQKNIGYDRNPTYIVEDLFFCEKCLSYKRIAVEKRTPKTGEIGDHIERIV